MATAAGIGAVGSVFGPIVSLATSAAARSSARSAANKARRVQVRALAEGLAQQKQLYEQGRTDLAPYRAVGPGALNYLSSAAEGATSPLYQLQLEDSEKAINRALAARGLFGSGVGIEALGSNARRLAASEAEARFGRNVRLAGIGQQAVATSAGGGQALSQSISDNYRYIGATGANAALARGQAGVDFAGAANQAIQGGLSNYYTQQRAGQPSYFSQFFGGGGTAGNIGSAFAGGGTAGGGLGY